MFRFETKRRSLERWPRTRPGLSLVEMIVGLSVATLLLTLAITIFSKGAVCSGDISILESGLADLARVRTVLERDLAAAPSDAMLEVEPSRVRMATLARLAQEGTVRLEWIEYRLEPAGKSILVVRQGRRLAGTFLAGRFERRFDAGGGTLVRLELSARGTAKGQATGLAMSVPVPRAEVLAGLQSWWDVAK